MLSIPEGPLSVVCIGAHPDDVEIACGGTLLRLQRERPLDVAILILTGTELRTAEARAAAAAFAPTATVEFADFGDGYLPESWGDVKRRVHAFAAEHPTPDLVFAPRVDDAHQDHRLLGVMAPTVWRSSLVLHYEIPKWDGDVGRPSTYIPIPDDLAHEKVRLLSSSYPSQVSRDWWDDEMFLGFLRLRGMECRHRYAEAFVVDKCVLTL